MEKVFRLVENAKRISINQIFKEWFGASERKNLIIRLNTQEQLFSLHIDSEGNPITNKQTGSSAYSITTEKITGGRKKAGTSYTLKDTGEFFSSFKIDVTEEAIIIDAQTVKDDGRDLLDTYGNDILGLTDENLQLIIDHFIDALPKIISDKLFQ